MDVAAHIHNCTLRRGFNDFVLRIPTGDTPDLSYLRTFGCPAFVHVSRATRPKTAPSARKGIFVGYSRTPMLGACGCRTPVWASLAAASPSMKAHRLGLLNRANTLSMEDN
jgi:hypothetical protein